MKIRTQITFPILIIVFVLLIFIGWFFYFLSSGDIKNEITDHLQTVGKLKGVYVVNFLENKKAVMSVLSESRYIKQFLNSTPADENFDFYFSQAMSRINGALSEEVYEVGILDKNNTVVVSTREGDIGSQKINISFPETGKGNLTVSDVYLNGETGKYFVDIYKTILDYDNQNSIGSLVFKVDLSTLYGFLLERSEVGTTEESYLVSKDYYMISPSRFIGNAILSQKIENHNTRACFGEKNGLNWQDVENGYINLKPSDGQAVNEYLDYRGIKVWGTYRYIPIVDWCLLVEYDKKESMAPASKLIIYFSLVILSSIFLFWALIVFISRRITKPIESLRTGIQIIEKGDFSYKIDTSGENEIGELAKAFDKMKNALQKSRKEIDKKVDQQTAEITEKQLFLEEQQRALLNILEDVQEEKDNVSRERDKIDAILYSIGDGVVVIDNSYKIILFNKIASDISGFPTEEVIGKKYDEILKFVYEKNENISNPFIEEVLNTGKIRTMSNHTLLIKKDGTKVPVADSAAPIKDKEGRLVGSVIVFRDATKEREIDKMKTEFVSVASHQLRTPLTGIKWFADLILKGKAGELNEKQKDFLNQIYISNERMIDLVGDLLDVSRIETGVKFVIKKKPSDIMAIVNNVIGDSIPTMKMKGVEVELNKESPKKLMLNFDAEKIHQVLRNLIDNAIKYSKKGGVVEVGCKNGDREVVFFVKDTGLGIPGRQQQKVFKRFFRADNVLTTETSGTGLGLYIAKAIVENHGGSMWFESEENKGSIFYFSLLK